MGGGFNVTINANDIIIQKNRIKDIIVNENHKGTAILQNYIFSSQGSGVTTHIMLKILNDNEVFIANNIIWCSSDAVLISASDPTITISIMHNIFISQHTSLTIHSSNIYVANNIILSGSVSRGTCDNFYNNMSFSNQLPNGNGNLIDMAKVFVDPTKDFHLLKDSPAKGAGTDGVDMGIYGGSTPYVDDGRTSLPSIVKFKTDHSASHESGLEIEIQAVSNSQ